MRVQGALHKRGEQRSRQGWKNTWHCMGPISHSNPPKLALFKQAYKNLDECVS